MTRMEAERMAYDANSVDKFYWAEEVPCYGWVVMAGNAVEKWIAKQ